VLRFVLRSVILNVTKEPDMVESDEFLTRRLIKELRSLSVPQLMASISIRLSERSELIRSNPHDLLYQLDLIDKQLFILEEEIKRRNAF
jgi:hypothetical protein